MSVARKINGVKIVLDIIIVPAIGKTTVHVFGAVADGEVKPFWEATFLVFQKRMDIKGCPDGLTIVVF